MLPRQEAGAVVDGKEVETSGGSSIHNLGPPHRRRRSLWLMRLSVIGLTVALLLVGLSGVAEQPILNYDVTIKYQYGTSSLAGHAKLSGVTVEEALYRISNQTLMFDSINDSVTIVIVNMASPTQIVLSNSTTSENATTTGFNEVFPKGLHYVTATDAFRNITVGPQLGEFDLNMTSRRATLPVFSIGGLQGATTPTITTGVWLYPGDASSNLVMALNSPRLQVRNGPLLSMDGPALLSVPSFTLAFVGFTTRSHSFAFNIGDNLTWSGGSLMFTGANGTVFPSLGYQKPLSDASFTTVRSPARSTVAFVYDRSADSNEVRVHLETTTVQVTDATGSSFVGQITSEQPLWNLDPSYKVALLITLTIAVNIATFMLTPDRTRRGHEKL